MTERPPEDLRAAWDRHIISRLRGRIDPPPLTMAYRLSLMLTAVLMLALPLVYLSLVALLAYGIYWHGTEHVHLMKLRLGGLILWAGPLVIGVVLLFFLLEPVFRRRPRSPLKLSLDREAEPLLFAWIDAISRMVRAPLPRRIDVDLEVNASASFRRGFFSFLGDDLVLTLGLPLVSGLSLVQLSGVMAHEMGHFGQGTGMRLSYLVRTMNAWYAGLVYGREDWDERFARWSKKDQGWLFLLVQVTRLAVWSTQKLLFAILWLGHMASSHLLRQMEFDADRYEIALAGSATFGQSMLRMDVLSWAWSEAHEQLGRSWSEGRLGDNFVVLVDSVLAAAPAALVGQIEAAALERTTSWGDTHPASAARIAAADLLDQEGRIKGEAPATHLFHDFAAVCRLATLRMYEQRLDAPVEAHRLRPSEEVARDMKSRRGHIEALQRLTHGLLDADRPIEVESLGGEGVVGPELLVETRQVVERMRESAAGAHEVLMEADRDRLHLSRAEAFVEAELEFDEFDVGALRDSVSERTAAHLAQIDTWRRALGRRFEAGLSRIGSEEIRSRARGAAGAAERAVVLKRVLAILGKGLPELLTIRTDLAALTAVLEQLGRMGDEPAPGAVRVFRDRLDRLEDRLADLYRLWADEEYPYRHLDGPISLDQQLLGPVPESGDIGSVAGAAERVLDLGPDLYTRILGELAHMVEIVEAIDEA